jgi:hypothetical protein
MGKPSANEIVQLSPRLQGRLPGLSGVLVVSAFATTLVWSFLFMCSPVWENDIWWHLEIGEYIWQNKEFPTTAMFPYAYQERPFVNLHWLYEVAQYGFYRLGGWGAIIVTHALAIVTAMLLAVLPMLRRKEWLSAAWLLFVASFVLNRRSLVRPEAYSFVLLAIYLAVLEAYRRRGSKAIYVLPLLQIIWVNCQSLFVLGLGLGGLYWLDEVWQDLRGGRLHWRTSLGLVLLLTAAACLCHPLGWHATFYPLGVFAAMRGSVPMWKEVISEFWPLSQVLPDWHWLPFTATVIMLLLPLCLLVLEHGRLPMRCLVLYAVFLYLTLVAVRNLALLVLVAGTLVSHFWQQPAIWQNSARLRVRACRPMAATVLLSIAVYLIYLLASQRYYPMVDDARQFGWHGIAASRYPVKAVDYVVQHALPGRLFHDLNDGGYLIWRLFPRYQVFIDTRIDPVIMSEEHFGRYLRMCEERAYFDQMADRYRINTVILRPCSSLQCSTFARVFEQNARWQPVFFDAEESSLVLVRSKQK